MEALDIIGVIMLTIGILGMGLIIALSIIKNWDIMVSIACILTGIVVITMGIYALAISKRMKSQKSSIDAILNTESVTETQSASSRSSSDIKVAILKKYPGAEIINTTDSSIGYFIYEQEKYSFESENNILFISKDNKTIDFIYLD